MESLRVCQSTFSSPRPDYRRNDLGNEISALPDLAFDPLVMGLLFAKAEGGTFPIPT